VGIAGRVYPLSRALLLSELVMREQKSLASNFSNSFSRDYSAEFEQCSSLRNYCMVIWLVMVDVLTH